MKKTFKKFSLLAAFFALLLFPLSLQAQKKDKNKVYDVSEVLPEFPGGTDAMMSFLGNNIKYPAEAEESTIQGRVIVQFIVDKKGKITEPRIVRGVDPLLDDEAIRVINSMPRWKPGLMKGKPVNVRFTLPIQFKLNNELLPAASTNKAQPVTAADTEKLLPLSKGLVGIWRLVGVLGADGKMNTINSGNYKVINPDNTLYTFIVWGQGKANPELPTQIGFYGTYTNTSDSTYTEHCIENTQSPVLNGEDSEIKYQVIDNNVLMMQYRNKFTGNRWVPEVWRRVELPAPRF